MNATKENTVKLAWVFAAAWVVVFLAVSFILLLVAFVAWSTAPLGWFGFRFAAGLAVLVAAAITVTNVQEYAADRVYARYWEPYLAHVEARIEREQAEKHPPAGAPLTTQDGIVAGEIVE